MTNPEQLGISKREFQHYLAEFRKAKYFAAIKVGGESLDSDLAEALVTLHSLDLLPIVVHGAGRQIDQVAEERGMTSKKIDGKRITDKKTLDIVIQTLQTVNQAFVSEVNKTRHCAEGLNGIFYVDGIDPVYEHVGNVIGMDRDKIDDCLKRKLIPIISSYGIDPEGNCSNPNADSGFRYLVSVFRPDKVLFLTSVGGVYRSKELISEMRKQELDEFIESSFVGKGMKHKLKEARRLLNLGFDVQITSPEHLIKELFSKKGYGTYLHK